jgi:hypothetical protein
MRPFFDELRQLFSRVNDDMEQPPTAEASLAEIITAALIAAVIVGYFYFSK